jgi:hypothetical protein
MSKKDFDPDKFVDREFEQELFKDILKFESLARILAICDKGGMGKSHLLEKFRHRCRISKPRIPVSLIRLNELPDSSPFSLVKAIERDLSSCGLRFERFKEFESARVAGDFNPFRSAISLEGSTFENATDVRIASSMTNVDYAGRVIIANTGVTELSPEQDSLAREVVIDSFFEDLHRQAVAQTVVLMFDAFEKCPDSLQKWVIEYLLERHFFNFNQAQSRFVFVLAGQVLPPFHAYWSSEDCAAMVHSVDKLAKWNKEHVAECLRAHGFAKYEQEDLEMFYRFIERGFAPSELVQFIYRTIDKQRGEQ